MDFAFSEEQQMLRDAVASWSRDRFPEGRVAELATSEAGWDAGSLREMAGLGWTGLALGRNGTEAAGSATGFLDEAVVVEELGKALWPGPYLTSVAFAAPALRSRTDYLARIAEGEGATLAWAEPDGPYLFADLDSVGTKATHSREGWSLTGVKDVVPDLGACSFAVVAARAAEGLGLWTVETDAADVRVLPTVDATRRLGRLTLDATPAELVVEPGAAAAVLESVRLRALAAVSVEAVGVASSAVAMARAYAGERQQFGRPIGAYQAVSHQVADAYMAVELARSLAYWAAWCVDEDDPQAPVAVAAAKSSAGDAAVTACEKAIQVLGGIGFTWEHVLHRYYKRALWIATFEGAGARATARGSRRLCSTSGIRGTKRRLAYCLFVAGTRTAALIESLPDRLRDVDLPAASRYRLRIGRTVRDVSFTRSGCSVTRPEGAADVEIVTDSRTWAEIDAGHLSGIEAFAQRRLVVRGSIEKSLLFEPLFDRPRGGGLEYEVGDVRVGRLRFSALRTGPVAAPPLLLIHGLGASKASWLTVVPRLARRHRVVAVDLPGFGATSKPRGRYDAPWFAKHVLSFMEVTNLRDALVAGNSMGGRVAMELAMREPHMVRAIACLSPVAAFYERPFLWAARWARPEAGILALRLPRAYLSDQLRHLFADPKRLHDDWYEAAIDDFLQTWRRPTARMAFFASLKNIYVEEPEGEAGFWSRLEKLQVPALYVYGRQDVLISPRFGGRVARALPAAKVEVWDDCGHAPQLEHPERTAEAMLAFFASVGSRRKAG
ncbi:MAG: alpha/beta fold hydrolase [Actinomycetota bacterium]